MAFKAQDGIACILAVVINTSFLTSSGLANDGQEPALVGAPVEKVFETQNILAFRHTQPFWEVHIVVIPKKHISSLLTVEKDDDGLFLELFDVIRHVSAQVLEERGAARVLTNLGNYQDSKHLHFHIYSGDKIRND